MGSGLGEFRLVGGLSGRLFIASVVIAVGKRAVSMSEAVESADKCCLSLRFEGQKMPSKSQGSFLPFLPHATPNGQPPKF